jgi:ParB family chromosome partitioning protein
MEMARAYQRMMNEFGLTQDIIAQRVGCERSSIANVVRLLNLPSEVQQLIESGQLSAGHAKVILGLVSATEQLRLAQLVIARNLSVRDTEKMLASSVTARKRQARELRRSPLLDLEERLQKRFGTKVSVHNGKRGGRVVIHYFSPAELDGLLEQLLQ